MNADVRRIIKTGAFCALALTMLAIIGLAIAIFLTSKPSLYGDITFSQAYYDRDGKLLRVTLSADQGYRLPARLEDIDSDLLEATLLQEDRYFYYHPGVNPFALLRGAYETYIARSRPIGGSTITMQLVRIRDDLDTRSIGGKLVQIYKALRLESRYSKKDILEAYLNLAPYGGNIYGIRAASLIYFKQKPADLSLPQSLALAVIPQNPVQRFPLNNDTGAWEEARNRLFAKTARTKREKYKTLMAMKPVAFSRADLPFKAPHFIDGLIAGHKRTKNKTGIKTTIDSALQATLEQGIRAYIDRNKAQGFDNAAAMLVHTPTMEVRALNGSAAFHNSAIDGQVDGTAARRSPGSTLKPFVYALALDKGLIHPESLLEDELSYFGEYRPGNFDKTFSGRISARDALVKSRNIPAITLAARLENPDIYGFLQKGGAGFRYGRRHYGLSMVVGGAEIDMRALVRLYAMLANQGVLRDLKYTEKEKPESPLPMLSPEAALMTLDILKRPAPARIRFTDTRDTLPVYWKTGTSNGFRDAWTIGVFGPYVMAVWVGHFDGRANPAFVGAEAAAPLFFTLAAQIQNHAPLTDKVAPAIAARDISTVAICKQTGLPADCPVTQDSLFIPGKSPFADTPAPKDALRIASPRETITYSMDTHNDDKLQIPLQADLKGQIGNDAALYWFSDNRYLGQSTGQQTIFWSPAPGTYKIRVTDARGHSDNKTINVEIR